MHDEGLRLVREAAMTDLLEHLARVPEPARSKLLQMREGELRELLCRTHVGVWAERKLGFDNAPVHMEWYRLMMTEFRLCCIAPRDHAKALGRDTKLLTPFGYTTMAEVQPGDVVLGGDGKPTRVTYKSEVFTDKDCHRVTLDDGQSFVATGDHQWITHYAWRGTRVVTTDQIIADHGARRDQRHVIDCVGAEFPAARLPLDPYVLGVWLGDGNTADGLVTNPDPEVWAGVEAAGFRTGSKPWRKGCWRATVKGLVGRLREMGVLGHKHVPREYLWADRGQRLALLRGLLDTDGTCNRGQVVFTQVEKNRDVVDAVCHLVWSLGWKPKRYVTRAKLNGVDYDPVYGVTFYPDEPVFTVPRKLSGQRTLRGRSKAVGRAVVSVEPTLTVPTQCVGTEAGSYLIGESVVTHNSQCFTVNQTCWRSIYTPGHWTYVFAQTGHQSQELLGRIVETMGMVDPGMVEGAHENTADQIMFRNGSRVTVAGAGRAVRTAHPDLIIGDDVLSDESCGTALQRGKTETWWFGTVSNMAHPETTRPVLGTVRAFGPTRIHLVGTPFHRQDLLMKMKFNEVYRYRRYAAEFQPEDLVDGLAVDVS